MIVTAHQANYLPGASVISKIQQADAVIWLDTVQYTHGGYSNRNRMPDGSWLTVPVVRETDMDMFNKVRISDQPSWRQKHTRTLTQHYGAGDEVMDIVMEISKPYELLIGLNLACLRVLLADTPATWHFQSHLVGGTCRSASERLARMVREIGGTVYLSGPSGRGYLDETQFADLDIEVRYFDWTHSQNPCAVGLVAA
jgi:hypothetical protein